MLKCYYNQWQMTIIETMLSLMGGHDLFKEELQRDADLENIVTRGLPAQVVRRLADSTGTSLKDLQEITHIDRSTFSRRIKHQALLKTDESDRIARVARVAALAVEALGRAEGLQWLQRPNVALGGRVPLSMLGTDAGVRQVEQIIGRIEHGVFS